MIHWCTVLVGMSLAFAVSTKHIEPSLSEEKIISANLNDLLQKIQIETLREKDMEEENQFPRTHEVIRIPGDFYGSEFIYTGANYPGIVGALAIDYVFSPEDNLSRDPEQFIPPNQENIQLEDQNHVNLLMDMNNNYDDDIENVDPNIVQPLNVWPQLVPLYVQEKTPSLENFGNDDLDVLNPANTEFSQSNARPNRRLNDNFMAELGYKAMMTNMLPTMSYVRGAEFVPLPMSQAELLLPENARDYLNGCGLPIVFSCYPNVYNGIPGSFEQPATSATTVSPPRGDIEFLNDVVSTDEDE